MSKLSELQTRRETLDKQIRAKVEDSYTKNGNKWADGEEANYNTLNTEYQSVMSDITKERSHSAITDRLKQLDEDGKQRAGDSRLGRSDAGRNPDEPAPGEGKPQITEKTRSLAMAGFLRNINDIAPTKRQNEAMQLCKIGRHTRSLNVKIDNDNDFGAMQQSFRNGHLGQYRNRLAPQLRALSAIEAGKGGVLVPSNMIRELEVNLLYFGGMLQVAEIINTDAGGELPWPTVDDTGNTGSRVGENSETSESQPTFGALVLRAHKYTSDPILVPQELLEDNGVNLELRLGQMMGERIARKQNLDFTLGDGSSKPSGIVPMSALGTTTASATAITFDELIDLEHSVDPAYRNSPGVGYMLNDRILAGIRKLKDGSGAYLFTCGRTADKPDMINGFPVTVNNDMQSSISASTKTVLFGDLSKYKVRLVRQIRIYRLEERYREKDQTGLHGLPALRWRFAQGGQLR